MGSTDEAIEIDVLERHLLSDTASHDDGEAEDETIVYDASFKEMEDSYVKYQTAQWVLYSLLLILAWGIGLFMLFYLPVRRYILRKEFQSRKLYVTPNAIVYKYARPVPFPCFGVLKKEKHVLLPSVADIVVEQGYFQSLFGIYSVRIENAGARRPANDDVQIQGVSHPSDFRKAVLAHLSNLRNEGFAQQVSTSEDQSNYGAVYSSPHAVWGHHSVGTVLTSQLAIESGRLPGDILDDKPGKYFDGTIVCEVRDYRKCMSKPANTVSSVDGFPIVNKVPLRMSLENVVKDIPSISDDSWTYSDLMEVESRILKALQPQLCLDPTPKMDRLCGTPVPNKLDLGIYSGRRKRMRQAAEVTITSNNQTHGKKVSIDKVPENANCYSGDSGPISADAAMQQFRENAAQYVVPSGMPGLRPKNFGQEVPRQALPFSSSQPRFQSGVGYPRIVHDRLSAFPANASTLNPNSISASGADLINSYTDNMSCGVSSLQGKRENQDGQLTPISGIKRSKQTPMGGLDSPQQQQAGPPLDGLQGADMHWKNSMFHQQQSDARGNQYAASIGGQKYAPQVMNDARQAILQGAPNQDAAMSFYLEPHGMMRYVKEERTDTDQKSNSQMLGPESNQLDPQQQRLQRQPQQQFMRSHFPPQTQWQNLSQLAEKDPRKDDMAQKRKSVQSPRVSSGPLVQSPASSKSGEISSGSLGPHFGAVATASTLGSQKEKAAGVSGAAAVGTSSVASSPSDSMQWQHQAPAAAKQRSNSLPKTQAISGMTGVGSPASVGNMSVPLNANSPSVGTPPLADTLERFSKIDMLTQRYQLNCKKGKVADNHVKKPVSYSTQQLHLTTALNADDHMDATSLKPMPSLKPMSKSLIHGSMNVCKSRVMTFMRAGPIHQGNPVFVANSKNKLILSERPLDGMVAMQLGDIDEIDFTTVQEHGPRLPNTNYADLLAAQFSLLMEREGYQLTEDLTRPMSTAAGPSSVPGISDSAATELQYPEAISGQPSTSVAPPNSGGPPLNSSQNLQPSPRMLPPGNSQALQLPQGYMSGAAMAARSQQLDQTTSLQQQQNQQSQIQQQQQQQHPQMQRSSLLHPSPLSHLNAMGQNPNLQMGNPMINKASPLQLQMLQQQQQQQQQQPQQQQQMQRKMMMGLGAATMGMGNIGNSMVGLGGLSNVVGMGGVRGMGSGISSPMGAMSGLGNMGQSPMNPSQVSNISNVISQHLRAGTLTPAQANYMAKLRIAQRGLLGGPQSGITGMSGNNQMHASSPGLSMLGQTLNRANMNPLQQRTAMAPMGPPKIPGANFYMNQQQQQLQLQQQQQQLQQQQLQQQQMSAPLQQQQMQQQQIGSPLQHQQAGSPSAMAIQQQLSQQQPQISPPQAGQQNPLSPQQLSSGALQQMNAGNAGAGPASPQLSSQTLGSVGSISSSPMELQGVNKGNSINNV